MTRGDTGIADVLVRKRDAVAQTVRFAHCGRGRPRSQYPRSQYARSRIARWNIPHLLVSKTSLAAHEEVVWQNPNLTPNL